MGSGSYVIAARYSRENKLNFWCGVCRIGEERAYWSLGNAYTCLGEHRQARHYAERHLQLATDMGDVEGVAIAQQNLRDLDNALDLSDK